MYTVVVVASYKLQKYVILLLRLHFGISDFLHYKEKFSLRKLTDFSLNIMNMNCASKNLSIQDM